MSLHLGLAFVYVYGFFFPKGNHLVTHFFEHSRLGAFLPTSLAISFAPHPCTNKTYETQLSLTESILLYMSMDHHRTVLT